MLHFLCIKVHQLEKKDTTAVGGDADYRDLCLLCQIMNGHSAALKLWKYEKYEKQHVLLAVRVHFCSNYI